MLAISLLTFKHLIISNKSFILIFYSIIESHACNLFLTNNKRWSYFYSKMISAKRLGYIDLDMEQNQDTRGQNIFFLLHFCVFCLDLFLHDNSLIYVFIGVRVYTFVGKQIFVTV